MDQDLEAAAMHEAGHIITTYICGGSAVATLREAGAGRCMTRMPAGNSEKHAVCDALISVSGLVCESAFARWDERGSVKDLHAARVSYERARLMGSPFTTKGPDGFQTFRVMCDAAARTLVKRHEPEVRRLADELRRFDSVDEADVGQICADVPRLLAGDDWAKHFVSILELGAKDLEERQAAREAISDAYGRLARLSR